MSVSVNSKDHLLSEGFSIIEDVFTNEEIDELINIISKASTANSTFRKTADLFAIRQFLKEIPGAKEHIFNKMLKQLIINYFGKDYFVVKSIYFDKPEQSNWFVSYHQDLTISVDKKMDVEGFGPWTVKQNQFSVQPTLDVLENNFTIRIHLDDTDENNGALKVIPKSHLKGVYRPETIDWKKETESICSVKKGGVMFMKPLLLHSSNRTINNNKRRVIHIEFSNQQLHSPLQWSEKLRF
jgi:ectoine hydroxylase-related dioxygenase (phytanoyl-CoA dioxygenase family)